MLDDAGNGEERGKITPPGGGSENNKPALKGRADKDNQSSRLQQHMLALRYRYSTHHRVVCGVGYRSVLVWRLACGTFNAACLCHALCGGCWRSAAGRAEPSSSLPVYS